MEGAKKVSLRRFLADLKIASSWKEKKKKRKKKKEKKKKKKKNWGILVARHILTTGLQKCL